MMDPEGVVRTTRWHEFESGGDIDWTGLIASLGRYGDPPVIAAALRERAQRLRGLPDRLQALGLPEAVLASRPLGLAQTEAKLARWGLV